MDDDVLLGKLEALSRCIARIETRTPDSCDALKVDIDAQDIISVNLERAVQTAVDIASHISSSLDGESPKTMAETFRALATHNVIPANLAQKMMKAVGFRNIAVHQYQSLDWNVVYSIATKDLDDFRQFAKAILAWSEKME